MGKRLIPVLVTLTVVGTLLAACATPTPTPAPEVTPAPVPTTPPVPTATPVPPPQLGTTDNPIIMGFVPSGTAQEILTGGEAIAKQITDLTGYSIKVFQATSYSALVEAMGSGNAQIGWLAPFPYTVAKQKGYADVSLVTLRQGSDRYGFQIIAHVDSAFTASQDPATALAQLKDRKPCWTDSLSSYGYVLPTGFFKKSGVPIKSGSAAAFMGGDPAVVRAVYAKAICDFGATFIDARTSPAIQKDLPDAMDKVMVIYKSDAFIPKDTVSFEPDLPADMRAKIVEALLTIAGTEAGKTALKTVFSIDGLKAADDTIFDEFRVYLEASGLDVATLFE
jgi:phosphonate transport system substrate-binding protein